MITDLEWTTDPPTEEGIYLVKFGQWNCVGPTRLARGYDEELSVRGESYSGSLKNVSIGTVWIGPLEYPEMTDRQHDPYIDLRNKYGDSEWVYCIKWKRACRVEIREDGLIMPFVGMNDPSMDNYRHAEHHEIDMWELHEQRKQAEFEASLPPGVVAKKTDMPGLTELKKC